MKTNLPPYALRDKGTRACRRKDRTASLSGKKEGFHQKKEKKKKEKKKKQDA